MVKITQRFAVSLFVFAIAVPLQTPLTNAADSVNSPAQNAQPQTAKWAEAWWIPRHQAKLQEIKSRNQIDLVLIGDSITQGWENSGNGNPDWNVRPIWERHFAHRHALNLGFSGDRTEHILWRLKNGEGEGLNPKLAIILAGTNNLPIKRETPEETAAGVLRIVDEVHARMPSTIVLLVHVLPRAKQPNDPLRVAVNQVNAALKLRAQTDTFRTIDVGEHFLDQDGTLITQLMPDALHPNAKGYARWATAMEPVIAELMNLKTQPPTRDQ